MAVADAVRRPVAAGVAALALVAAVAVSVVPRDNPPSPAAIPAGAAWFSTFDEAYPWAKWEGYARPLQLLQGGAKPDQIQVVDASSQGIPPPPGYPPGTKVLLAQVSDAEFHQYADDFPRSYCCVHAKLYHGWGGGSPGDGPRLEPGQESGTYRAWYYLPRDTPTFPYKPHNVRWVNVMQWKSVGGAGQQVNAEADLVPVNGRVWLCLGRGWPQCDPPSHANAIPAPLGRWFELRADLFHQGRIDWYLDGRHVWTSPVVGLQPGQGWIFGIGHYGGVGKLYAKNASFTPAR